MSTMPAQDIFETLHDAGLRVSLTRGGDLEVSPASSLTEELRVLIRGNKAVMVNWLARLKNINTDLKAEPTKPGDVDLVGLDMAPMQKTKGDAQAENNPSPVTQEPYRWCWPHSEAMTGAEIDTFTARLARFTDKGLAFEDSDELADKLVLRDRDLDDRRVCLECKYLAGLVAGSWRCGNCQAAGVANCSRDAQLASDLVVQLQRCDGFTAHLKSTL